MNKQITDIVSYLSWPGLLIAFFLGDRYASRFHLCGEGSSPVGTDPASVSDRLLKKVRSGLVPERTFLIDVLL